MSDRAPPPGDTSRPLGDADDGAVGAEADADAAPKEAALAEAVPVETAAAVPLEAAVPVYGGEAASSVAAPPTPGPLTPAPLTPGPLTAAPLGSEPGAQRRGVRLLRLAGRHWPLWPLLAIAVAARLPLLLAIHAQPASDSYFYVTSARAIAAGHGYLILGHPTAFFPVGWPAFLGGVFALFGDSFRVVMLTGMVLWVIAVGLLYAFATRMGGRLAGTVAGLLIALNPDLVPFVLRAASENLVVPLLLLVALLLQRRRGEGYALSTAALAGAFLGLTILVRSTALLLPPFLGLWMWLSTRRRGHAFLAGVLFVAAAYFIVSPWVVRNVVVMKTFAVSTNGGYTLWLGDNPLATGGNEILGRRPMWPVQSAAAEVADNSYRTRLVLSFVRHHPGQMLRLAWPKAQNLFRFSPDAFPNAFVYHPQSGPLARARPRALTPGEARILATGQALYPLAGKIHYVFWAVAAVALALALWRRPPGAGFVAVVFFFWLLLHVTVVHGQPRYVVSIQPLMAAPVGWLVAWAWSGIWRLARPARTRP